MSVCVCDGGWGLHLLPLSCCQAGDQPTAPGLKPSLRRARTTRERESGIEKEMRKRGRDGKTEGESKNRAMRENKVRKPGKEKDG